MDAVHDVLDTKVNEKPFEEGREPDKPFAKRFQEVASAIYEDPTRIDPNRPADRYYLPLVVGLC